MAIIYRKTVKGVDEVNTRVHRLAPRARTALILVDGQRSAEDLAKLIQVQASETLALLLEQGFIEVAGAAVGSTARPATATAAVPAGYPEAAGDSQFSSTSAPQRNFTLVRREAVRRLNDLMGPEGEMLAIKMEATRDLATLRPLLVRARDLIAMTRGQKAAADYIAALSAL